MTDFTPDPDPTSSDETRRRFGLSTTQVVASALAAISSAVAASYLGVAGTVLGAGFGSIVATVSTALYQHSLTRTNERLKRVAPAPIQAGRTAAAATVQLTRVTEAAHSEAATVRLERATEAMHSEAATVQFARATEVAPTQVQPVVQDALTRSERDAPAAKQPKSWPRIAAAAAGVFVVTLGSIAVFEQFAGGSLSSVVRGTERQGTTLGDLARPEPAQKQPAVSPTPSSTPSQLPSPTTTPTPTAPATTPPATTPTSTPPPTPTTEPVPSTSPSAG